MASDTDKQICPLCGYGNAPGRKLCWHCQQPMPVNDASQSPPGTSAAGMPSQPVPSTPPYQQPMPMNNQAFNTSQNASGSYASSDASTNIIIGWICAVISLLFCPILFGAIAIINGNKATAKGDPRGQTLSTAATAMMIVGIIIGVAVRLATHR